MNTGSQKNYYRNAEHYYDPTAGEAIANVCGDIPPGPLVVEEDDMPENCPEMDQQKKQLEADWEDSLEASALNGAPVSDLLSRCMSTTWGQRAGNGRKRDQVTFEDFANAIIVQAVNEYRAARRLLRDFPGDPEALEIIHEVVQFFHSSWYAQLTTLEGTKLLKMLQEEDIE